MDDQIFTLYFTEFTGEKQPVVFQSIYVEEVFRFFNEMVSHNNAEWRFDGDGFHTELDFFHEFDGKVHRGGYLITRW